LLGVSGDACLVHKGTLIDGICLDDWYLSKSTPFVLLSQQLVLLVLTIGICLRFMVVALGS
jgi:hypothetical protein